MKFWDSIFKPARSNNRIWNLLKTLFQTSIFWTTFLIVFPYLIFVTETSIGISNFKGTFIIGGVFFIIFSILGLISGYTMSWYGKGTPLPTDCPNELVVRGPYRFVRNPLAVAGIGQGVCVGLMLGSVSVIIYAFIGAILWHFLVRPSEERDLEKRFGSTYLDYKKSVRCWIPKF